MNTGPTGVLILNGDLLLNNFRDATDGSTSARNVLISGSGTMATPSFDGTLDLGGVVRNITVSSSDPTLTDQGPINGGGVTGGVATADGNRADSTIETVVTDGGINKLGGRVLRLTNANTYAGGTYIREGAIRISNNLALGTGATQVFDGASLQIENNTANGVTTGLDVTNAPLTVSGNGVYGTGTLDSTAGTNIWASPITMLSNTSFGAEGTSVLVLTAPLIGNFSWTKVGNGTVLLAPTVPSNSFGTNVTVGNGILAFANDGSALNGRVPTVNSGASLGLFWDGTPPNVFPTVPSTGGTGDQETYLFPAIPAVFLGDFGLEVNRTGLLTGPQYTTPANKTIQYDFANLPAIANQNITITNTNGYGLELLNAGGPLTWGTSGSPVSPNFVVVNASTSNVVQGLTINALISGTGNITKSGAGALVLTDPSNSFSGNITVIQGVLSAGNSLANDDNNQLGAVTNEIILAPTTGISTFRATANTTFGTRQIQLANAVTISSGVVAREIDVTAGNTFSSTGNPLTLNKLTLNTPFDLNGGAGANANLVKGDSGILVLNAANSSWNGTLQIAGGAVQLANNLAAGSGAPVVSISTTTNGTTTATMTSTAGLIVGQVVSGTGIVPGTVITAINTTTSVVTLSQAATASGTNPVGYGGIMVSNALGAALQLSGGVTINNALNLNSSGTAAQNGGINFGGQLENVSGTNTYQGTISVQFDSLITADAGSTLHITGGIFNTGTNRNLTLGGAGTIDIDSALPILNSLTKVGSGTVFITVPQAASVAGAALVVQAGSVVISGAGNYTGLAAQGVTVNDGATFNLQDTGTAVATSSTTVLGATTATVASAAGLIVGQAVTGTGIAAGTVITAINTTTDTVTLSLAATAAAGTNDLTYGPAIANRLGGGKVTIQGGTFSYTVNSTEASSETMGVLALSNGLSHVNVFNPGGQSDTLTFTSLTQNTGSSVEYNGAFGTTTNRILFTTAPTLVGGLLSRAVVTTGGGFDFASYNTTGLTGTGVTAVANVNGLQAFSTYNTTNNLDSALATDTPKVTANTNISVSRTLNALAISGTGIAVGGVQGSTLTLTSGGILVTGGSDALNIPVVALAAVEGQVHINTGSTLTLGSAITGTVGVTKSDGGALDLLSPQYYSGTTWVDAGTLQLLNSSTNSLLALQTLIVDGGTLDLNGSVQYAGELTSVGTVAGSGGTITSTNGLATLVTTSPTSTTFAGQIVNSVTFNKAGTYVLTLSSPSTYTGATVVNGGTLALTDAATLSATSSIEIDNATLSIGNTGTLYNPDRVNNSAPVTLNAGGITFLGRSQTLSTESIGAVALNSGLNTITVTPTNVGVNWAMLTLADLQHGVGSSPAQIQASVDSMVNFVGPAVAQPMGALGNGDPRVVITNYNSNQAFIGGWAIVTTSTTTAEFAGYDKVLGVGALNTVGYAGYDLATIPTTTLPGQNIRLTATTTLPSEITPGVPLNLQFNSLNLFGNVNLVFPNQDTIDLVSGGLLKSGNSPNTFGASSGDSILTAGLGGAGTTTDLYIYNQQNSLTINSDIVDNGSGKVRLVVAGNGSTVALDGFNSYTGGTVVDGATVSVTNLIPGGGVTVNNGSLTAPSGDGVNTGIANTNSVTLNNGTFTFSGTSSLVSLSLNNTGAAQTQFTLSNAATLTLTGAGSQITASPTSVGTSANVATINGAGILDLGANNAFVVSVDRTLVNGADVAPLQAGLNIATQINDGGIAKQGLGVLELSSTASLFSGGVDLQTGSLLIGAASIQPSGALTSGPLGIGTLTIHSGTTLLSAGNFGVANNYVIMGANNASTAAAFTFNGANSLQLNGTLTISAATPSVTELDIAVVNPSMTATLGGLIDTTVQTIVKSGLGTLVVNPNYTGTITVTGGAISLFADGDGTSTPQNLNFNSLSISAPTVVNVGRLATAHLPLYTLAANKTIELMTLNTGGNAITINNPVAATAGPGNGGYGLQVDGSITFNVDQQFNVTTATASNVVQGLTLDGQLSGAFNLIKGGNGTLVLGNPTNSFGGNNNVVDIQGGVVSIDSDSELGDPTNVVKLDVPGGQTTLLGLRVTGNVPLSLPTTRIINFAQANNGIEVVAGQTLTVNSAFTLGATTAALYKNDNGTLALAVDNPTWAGVSTTVGASSQHGDSPDFALHQCGRGPSAQQSGGGHWCRGRECQRWSGAAIWQQCDHRQHGDSQQWGRQFDHRRYQYGGCFGKRGGQQ